MIRTSDPHTPYFTRLLKAGLFFWLLSVAFGSNCVAGERVSDFRNLSLSGVNLSIRVLLQGPYDQDAGLMTDQLRVQGVLPTEQPYATPPFSYSGAERLSATVLSETGQDAVVDWVLLELREAGGQGGIVVQQAAVLQRDGDLVNPQNGETVLNFSTVATGNYRVSVRHRNHQGIVTQEALALSSAVTLVDFSSPFLAVQGQHSRLEAGGFSLLRTGDADQDGRLIAIGVGNDSNLLLSGVLTAPGNSGLNTSYQQQGYLVTDFNLDGKALYVGPVNDKGFLISNILLHPENVGFAANFIVSSNL